MYIYIYIYTVFHTDPQKGDRVACARGRTMAVCTSMRGRFERAPELGGERLRT